MQELVRYIHLNPLRAKIVKTLTLSEKYPYSGHSALMGKIKRDFQNTAYVLRLFGNKVSAARGEKRDGHEKMHFQYEIDRYAYNHDRP